MDLGAGRRGVDMGPSALRKAELEPTLCDLGHQVDDQGDLDVRTRAAETTQHQHLKFLPEIVSTCRVLANAVADGLQAGAMPLVLGGDHSMSIGTLAGLAKVLNPEKRFGVLWIDAHADLNTPETSPSGNIHGMPLAVALGYGAPELVALAPGGPALLPQDLVYIGLRCVDAGERVLIRELGIKAFTMREIDEQGIAGVAKSALEYLLNRRQHLHVSLDLDALDPSVAPGVGTPVRGGLTFREGHYLMETIAASNRLSSLELAEVNPILDLHNASSEVAVGLTASLMGRSVL
jgi:arginase